MGRRRRNEERDAWIYDNRHEFKNNAVMGNVFGISRERIRQIIIEEGQRRAKLEIQKPSLFQRFLRYIRGG